MERTIEDSHKRLLLLLEDVFISCIYMRMYLYKLVKD